jgi:hypothetical protein
VYYQRGRGKGNFRVYRFVSARVLHKVFKHDGCPLVLFKGERKMQIKRFRKVTIVSLTTMLLILTLLMTMTPLTVAESGDTLFAPRLTVPVTVDAVWSAGEWDDALQYTMVGNRTSYIRAKYDSNYLYVLVDIPWDTTNATYHYHENFYLAFDTAHDDGPALNTDDYLVSGQTDTVGPGALGIGWVVSQSSWTATYLGGIGTFMLRQGGSQGLPGEWTPFQPSPNSATPHRICEMKVPLALVGSPGSTVGFYANVDDESSKPGWPSGDPDANATAFSEWPSNAGGNTAWPGSGTSGSNPCPTPDNWGNLVLSLLPGTSRYFVMGGTLEACTQLGPFPATFWETPFQTRPPDLTPSLLEMNLTFSDPWELNPDEWIVNITVPDDNFVGLYHEWYDTTSGKWFNLQHYMPEGTNGYGWVFLNETGDVDCYTFNDDTGVYWGPESPESGELAAAAGQLPSNGTDGVAGTADDGFGDGTPDPPGSSIIMLPSWVRCEWAEPAGSYSLLFDVSWPVVFTTGTAYDIVDEDASQLDGVNATRTGKPWEFYAGLDHPSDQVPWGYGYCNAYATYACCWSMLDLYTADFGDLDVMFAILYKLMREDCVVADIKGENEEVDIFDVRRAAKAYGTFDESFPDKANADALFDAAADWKDPRGEISIFDIRRVAKDYGLKLTSNGIVSS